MTALIILLFLFFVQYTTVLFIICFDDIIESRKELKFWLLPFPIILFIKFKEMYKNLPKE